MNPFQNSLASILVAPKLQMADIDVGRPPGDGRSSVSRAEQQGHDAVPAIGHLETFPDLICYELFRRLAEPA